MTNINVRVKQYSKGWVVEIEKEINYILYKKRYWTHLISVAGISSKPWYFKSRINAINEAKRMFELELIKN